MTTESVLKKYYIDGKIQEIDPKERKFPGYVKCISEKELKCEVASKEQDKDGVTHELHYFVQFDLSRTELIEYAVRQFLIREWRTDDINGTNKQETEQLAQYKDQIFKVSDFRNKVRKSKDPFTAAKKDAEKLSEQERLELIKYIENLNK